MPSARLNLQQIVTQNSLALPHAELYLVAIHTLLETTRPVPFVVLIGKAKTLTFPDGRTSDLTDLIVIENEAYHTWHARTLGEIQDKLQYTPDLDLDALHTYSDEQLAFLADQASAHYHRPQKQRKPKPKPKPTPLSAPDSVDAPTSDTPPPSA